jgi:hypothetical protein
MRPSRYSFHPDQMSHLYSRPLTVRRVSGATFAAPHVAFRLRPSETRYARYGATTRRDHALESRPDVRPCSATRARVAPRGPDPLHRCAARPNGPGHISYHARGAFTLSRTGGREPKWGTPPRFGGRGINTSGDDTPLRGRETDHVPVGISCLPFGYPHPRSAISGLGNGGLQGLARLIGITIFESPTSPRALVERRARSPHCVVNRAHRPKDGCPCCSGCRPGP